MYKNYKGILAFYDAKDNKIKDKITGAHFEYNELFQKLVVLTPKMINNDESKEKEITSQRKKLQNAQNSNLTINFTLKIDNLKNNNTKNGRYSKGFKISVKEESKKHPIELINNLPMGVKKELKSIESQKKIINFIKDKKIFR